MIQIIDGFNLQTPTPIDSRIVVADDFERLAITSTYAGLRVWQVDTNTPYFWDTLTNPSTPDWKSELDLVVTGDGTTNFIPKFKSSNPTEIEDSQISDDGNLVTIDKSLTVGDDLTFGNLIGDLNADNITSGSLSLDRIYTDSGSSGDVLRLEIDGSDLVAKWTDISGIVIGTSNITEQVNLTKINTTSRYSFIIRDISDTLSISTKTNMDSFTYETDLIISEHSGDVCILAHKGTKENPPYSFYDTTLSTSSTPTITGGMYHTGDKLILSNRDSLNILVDKLVIDKKAVTFGSYGSYSPRIRTHQDPTNSAEPSYTWWGNDTTGMYRPDDNVIGFCVGGGVSGVGNPIMKIDLDGVHIKTSQYDNPDANDGTIVFNNINSIGVPIGGIIIWSGNPNDIGSGNLWNFAECDGGSIPTITKDGSTVDVVWSGTTLPDLEGRFALGSYGSTYESGDTAGSTNTHITEANLPKHSHFVDLRTGGGNSTQVGTDTSSNSNRSDDGSHIHQLKMNSGTAGTDAEYPDFGADGSSSHGNTQNSVEAEYSAHNHEVKGWTNEAGGDSSPQTITNMPPYLVVTYIIRLV